MGCCECESNLCITIHWDLPDSVIWLSESSLSFDSPLHAPPPIPKAQNTSASFSNTESSSQLIPKWKSDCLPWHTLVHNGSVCRVRWLRFKHETALPNPLTPPQFAGKGKCKSAKCSVTQPSLVKAPLCYLRALIINSLLSVEKKAL
jgi:hypothetical protein